MTFDKEIFVKNYLEKSQEALIDVELSLKINRLSVAQNRIYYSIFYSVMALGYFENFITSKHYPLMGWFNKKFVYEDKIFNKEMFQIYNNAYENRQKSDYSIYDKPVKSDIEKSFKDAKRFIKEVTSYIEKKSKDIQKKVKS